MAAAHISPCHGSWYPASEQNLNALLDRCFADSRSRTGPHILSGPMAFVVPHAAPSYCGTVAAGVYRHLQQARPERIFLLGFCHHGRERSIALPDVERYATPLGEVAVDRAVVSALCSAAPFHLADERDVCDHSVEIQLPYLRRCAPNASVIPLYVGHLDEKQRTTAAEALARMHQPGDILLASSDLTHYGGGFHYSPFPVDERTAGRLRKLDGAAIRAASSVNGALFLRELNESGATACGCQPIALLLSTLAIIDGTEIYQRELDYQTSGEIARDFSTSVSYAALGYFPRSSFELSEAEREELLLCAHATLRRLRKTGRLTMASECRLPGLARHAPVFVSIHAAGQPFGCVGHVSHDLPLFEGVPEMTIAAALDDPRRPPDCDIPEDAEIEISVLTPMKLVDSAEAIRLGTDGAHVNCGARSGLLLPQVARVGWTRQRFVDCLFRKAGIDAGARRADGLRLHVFQAQAFRR